MLVAVVVAFALCMVVVPSSAQQLVGATAGEREGLHAESRGLLAAGDPAVIEVPRKNITKAALIKLMDKGEVPTLLAGNGTSAKVVPVGGGRKLSQQAGYCRSRYYRCGRGCVLRCSGSTGYCYKQAWRCAGTYNYWYCNCGYYLACYYTWSGVYATCLR